LSKYPHVKWSLALVFTVSWIAQAASRSSSCPVSFTNRASRWASSSEIVWSSVCRLIILETRKSNTQYSAIALTAHHPWCYFPEHNSYCCR